MAKTPKSRLPRKSDEEIAELARALVEGRIFTSLQVAEPDQHLLRMIFMPLGFIDRKAKLEMVRKDRPGCFYADMKDAGPRAINGYPIFFSMSMLSEEDTRRMLAKYKEFSDALT